MLFAKVTWILSTGAVGNLDMLFIWDGQRERKLCYHCPIILLSSSSATRTRKEHEEQNSGACVREIRGVYKKLSWNKRTGEIWKWRSFPVSSPPISHGHFSRAFSSIFTFQPLGGKKRCCSNLNYYNASFKLQLTIDLACILGKSARQTLTCRQESFFSFSKGRSKAG